MENVFNQIYRNLIPGAQTIPTILWAEYRSCRGTTFFVHLAPKESLNIIFIFFGLGVVVGGGGGGGRRRIRRNRKALLHFSFFSFQLFSLSIQPGLKD